MEHELELFEVMGQILTNQDIIMKHFGLTDNKPYFDDENLTQVLAKKCYDIRRENMFEPEYFD
jgi:hypothetical protein